MEDTIEIIFEDEEELEQPNEFGVKLIKGFSIYKHQSDAIKWMKIIERDKRIRGGILSLTMGLGKTLSTTSLIMSENYNPLKLNDDNIYTPKYPIEENNFSFPNLIICSKTVSYEWKKDIDKFFGNSCKYLYFHKSELKTFDSLTFKDIKDYRIIITTYETVMNMAKKNNVYEKNYIYNSFGKVYGINTTKKPNIKKLNNTKGGMLLFDVPWNRVICDESHKFANPTSLTFYSVMAIYGEKKWCLSATPLKNYSSDLYSQFRFCGFDKVFSYKEFNYELYIKDKLFNFIMCKDYKDVDITLPKINENNIFIELEGNEKIMYDFYHINTKKVYNSFISGETSFSNVLTLFLRLRQICISCYTVLPESSRKIKDEDEYSMSNKILEKLDLTTKEWLLDKHGESGINSSKIKEIIKIISKIKQGEKTIVFTSFKKVIDVVALALKTHLPKNKFLIIDGDVTGQKREKSLDLFKEKDGGNDILLISFKVGSEGLNLVEANNVIMCENWWTPVVHQQAKSRCHRMGQKNEVNVWNIIIKNSIEDKINNICNEKLKMIDDFLISKKKISEKLDASLLGKLL